MILKHGFVKTDTLAIEDCIIITDAISKWSSAARHIKEDSAAYITLANSSVDEKIEENPVPPKKGCSLYVLPDCPVAMDSIRKNYTIKRKPSEADYIVFHDCIKTYKAATTHIIAWLPASNVFVMLDDDSRADKTEQGVMRRAQELYDCTLGILDWENAVITIATTTRFKMTVAPEMLCRLFCGFLPSKPALLSQLDLDSSEELTLDTLLIYYNAGKENYYNKGAKENFLLQVSAMDSYNWRKYKASLSLVNRVLKGQSRYTCYDESSDVISKLNKTQRLIISQRYSDIKSKEDFLLGQEFLKTILGIKDTMYVAMNDVVPKLQSAGVSLPDFFNYFNTVVRITTNEYKNAETDSDSVR